MYISIKDVEFLKELEVYLFEKNKDNMIIENDIFMLKTNDITDTKALEYYVKLYNLIEKLNKNRVKNNAKNWDRISTKRQVNPNYARSEKELKRRGVNNE